MIYESKFQCLFSYRNRVPQLLRRPKSGVVVVEGTESELVHKTE